MAFAIATVAFMLSPLFEADGAATLPGSIGWIGVAIAVAGVVLRFWSARVLGRFYTRTVTLAQEHRLVRDGPYRFVRHPGYAGVIGLWIGAGLAGGSAIVTAVIAVVILIAYRNRIRVEEAFLRSSFGDEYLAYERATWRLVPFLY